MAIKTIPSQKCTMCGKEKKINGTNFYKSFSPLFANNYEQRMCVCKDCLIDYCDKLQKIHGGEKQALYFACQLVNTYYSSSLFEQLNENEKTKNIYITYFSKINSLHQYKNKTFVDSDPYNVIEESEDILEDEFAHTGDSLIDFWGAGYSEQDYKFLENEYRNLTSRFECDSYSLEMLFQDIAFVRLDIRKKRQNGVSVDKELKTLQDLLGSANIKPAQESNAMASEQVTFGTLIKKFENEKPIPEPLPNWMDADWIRKYVMVFFFGNLCNMMGKHNPYQKEWEEEMGKYTIKPDGDSNG